jgi:transcriptional regulator with XRE-family HTH domain
VKFVAENEAMYVTTFHSALRDARASANLTLKQLQEQSGLPSRRLTRLERGIVLPTNAERDALARVLPTHMFGLRNAPARPPRLYEKLRNRGSRAVETPKPFFPPSDRASKSRLSTAWRRFPREMEAIVKILRRRPDFGELNCLAEDVALDSADECLYFSTLLALGGEPAMRAPYTLSPRLGHEVVCPLTREPVGLCPFPCLVTAAGIYFPQVAFVTPRLFIVDFLRHHQGCWSYVEIDGRGHDSRYDADKERALGMPVARFSEEQLLRWVRGVLREAG